MSDAQMYFVIGLPSGIALVGILVNLGCFLALNSRMLAIETRILTIETRVTEVEVSTAVLKERFNIILKKLDGGMR